jgi:ABC-type nitrate/sulfonate/bicarbonate transport system permease component
MRRAVASFLDSRAAGVTLLACVAVLWEAFARSGLINSIFLPPPTRILAVLASIVISLELPRAAAVTLCRCLGGYLAAAVIAVPLGVAMGRSRRLHRLLDPLVECLRPIPSAAVVPVAILFLGIGSQMKVAVIVFGTVWPILLNTIQGVVQLDPVLIDTGRTFGLGRRDFLLKIVLPAAMPSIMTGLRISLAISLILGITVEMIAGSAGLGFLILDYERSFKYAEMYAGIVCLGFIGLALNAIMAKLQSRYLAWSCLASPQT